jgi:hypothetical protein
MKYLLVKYHANWANEFDVDGFQALTEDNYIESIRYLKSEWDEDEGYTFNIGTNEEIEYDSIDDMVASNISTVEISEEQFNVLDTLFEGLSFGFFPL